MTYKNQVKKVKGRKNVDVFIFTLSTCGWCRKTKEFLKSMGIAYSYVDGDLLSDEDQSEVEKVFEEYETNASFPKIIVDNKTVISGFDEKELRKAIKK